MKFMKLGSKPDAFQADGNSKRYVTSELPTDVIINVDEVMFYIHKFPLLSKSNHLQKLVLKAKEDKSNEIHINNFPGGAKAFEICAKFCYGITVTLNAYNVVAARCAAEYLEMTEDVDRGNLIFKIEVFLNSSIFCSWKDSIIVLQTTKLLLPWSEDLKIVGRCVDSIASKTSIDPANITWSYTYNRKLALPDKIIEHDMSIDSVPKDWWVEDICELEIDLYKRVMNAVKSKGRMDVNVLTEALRTYVVRWLPDSVEALISDAHVQRSRSLLETIIYLLPSHNILGCTCSFLLKLLKVAVLVGADEPLRDYLVKRISLKLHEASVSDILIPARSPSTTVYDVQLIQCIVKKFMMNERCNKEDLEAAGKNEKGSNDIILLHGSILKVGKLIDGYLEEIANDPNLCLSRFMDLSQMIPESARLIHDGLYQAIDIYLKEHPNLTKAERKKLCALMDVRKLTANAAMHAAQNDRLPLRVVVQVLFFEQLRASSVPRVPSLNSSASVSLSMRNTEEESVKPSPENCKSHGKQMKDEDLKNKLAKRNSRSGAQLLPSRSRRIFDKLWALGKSHGENKSSETSGSSRSPTSLARGDAKSFGSSSRNRRHSIS